MQLIGLDLGTQGIKFVVAEIAKTGEIKILKVIESPSHGLRRGVIFDLDQVVAATTDIFVSLKKQYKQASRNIFVGVNGPQVNSQISRGIVAVSRADNEIYKDDIERVLKASQTIMLSSNRKIIHRLTREYIVDGVKEIYDPTGLVGNRLEVETILVDVFHQYLQNLSRLIELHGCGLGGYVLNPIAASRAVLTKNQRELGVLLLDIGAQTTGLTIYQENKLDFTTVLPLGSNYITNDVAVGFKISSGDAESLKMGYGYAISKHITQKDSIELKLVNATLKNTIPRRFLSEIIESRMSEVFSLVNDVLKRTHMVGKLPGGVVLVGGGAKLPGLVDLARDELRMTSVLGMPTGEIAYSDIEFPNSELEDPSLAVPLGLVLEGFDLLTKDKIFRPGNWGNPIINFFKSFLKSLLP